MKDGTELIYTFDTQAAETGIAALLRQLNEQGIEFKDLHTAESSLEDIFVSLVRATPMNVHAIRAIYTFEMSRTFRTIFQSIATPVITTSLYFVVFGSAIGSRMVSIDGVSYGAYIVPGLIMLTVLTESLNNASFGIYMPKFAGTIYEMLSAPISFVEVLAGYVGAAATKSVMLGSHHPRHRAAVRALRDPASVRDVRIPDPDLGDLQPARLRDRHLGR